VELHELLSIFRTNVDLYKSITAEAIIDMCPCTYTSIYFLGLSPEMLGSSDTPVTMSVPNSQILVFKYNFPTKEANAASRNG
jgi:hypothetical protein